MTFVTRVATLAAMSLSLVGLISTSAPSRAADLTRQAMQIPSVQLFNAPIIQAVPAIPAPVSDTVEPTPPQTSAETVEEREFASLAAAVAAQDQVAADDAMRCLAGAIYFESKGEPLSGQLAVAQVIINRANSGRFPPDVCGVVKQRGQFGFVRGGRIPSIDEARAAYRTAVAVARVALADAWDGAAEKALYFNTPNRAPAARLQRVAMIGNHIFYR